MFDISIKTAELDLSLKTPDKKFWTAVALEADKTIKKRTLDGKDVEGKDFRKYSKDYEEFRVAHGRTRKPNLTYTGRMLSSIRTHGYKDHAKVIISGSEGLKGWANEKRGRKWFDLSTQQINDIAQKVQAWVGRKNRLKK